LGPDDQRRMSRHRPNETVWSRDETTLVFDELPARESSFDVVPVADAVAFAELPAEQDLAAAAQRGEVDEPLIGVLDIDAEVRDLEKEGVDLLRNGIGGTPVV